MTVAEELRKHADLAIKEGGMYYRGEYLDAIARRAESEQAVNAKLRELVRISIEYCNSGTCDECPIQGDDGSCPYKEMALKLGVEVAE